MRTDARGRNLWLEGSRKNLYSALAVERERLRTDSSIHKNVVHKYYAHTPAHTSKRICSVVRVPLIFSGRLRRFSWGYCVPGRAFRIAAQIEECVPKSLKRRISLLAKSSVEQARGNIVTLSYYMRWHIPFTCGPT